MEEKIRKLVKELWTAMRSAASCHWTRNFRQ